MKHVILNVGSEYLTAALVNGNRNEKFVIERLFELDLTDYYSAQGTIDMKAIAVLVKENLKEHKRADITLILPSYVTNVSYCDIIAEPNNQPPAQSSINSVSVIRIGENVSRKVDETVVFNSKLMESIVREFYSNNLNVTEVLCAQTCYHNYMARFNVIDQFSEDPSINHIEMIWGSQNISYIVFTGNLPVASIPSEYNLLSAYRDLVSMGSQLSFSKMIKGFNLLYISAQSGNGGLILESSGETIKVNKVDQHLDVDDMDALKNVFYSFTTGLCQEIRSVYDHVVAEYGSQNVVLCSNSRLIDECVSHMISSDFPLEYIDGVGDFKIGDAEFSLKGVTEITDAMVPIIGAVIESIHKGVDFYAVR